MSLIRAPRALRKAVASVRRFWTTGVIVTAEVESLWIHSAYGTVGPIPTSVRFSARWA